MPRVQIDQPERMNLLGLILANVMERNLETPELQQRCAKLKGKVIVTAGEMVVTLSFDGGQVTVARGAHEPARSHVKGSLDALMALALGGGMVGAWLSGRLKTRGSLILLLKLRPLLQA